MDGITSESLASLVLDYKLHDVVPSKKAKEKIGYDFKGLHFARNDWYATNNS